MFFETTRVSVVRPDSSDPYEEPSLSTIASSAAAQISAVSASGGRVGGASERHDADIYSDLDLLPGDVVTDLGTEEVYVVMTTTNRTGLGLAYKKASMNFKSGQSNG
jgi:hypothetical protein